jgi:hypothetical protein
MSCGGSRHNNANAAMISQVRAQHNVPTDRVRKEFHGLVKLIRARNPEWDTVQVESQARFELDQRVESFARHRGLSMYQKESSYRMGCRCGACSDGKKDVGATNLTGEGTATDYRNGDRSDEAKKAKRAAEVSAARRRQAEGRYKHGTGGGAKFCAEVSEDGRRCAACQAAEDERQARNAQLRKERRAA